MDLIEYSKAGNPVLYFPDGGGTGRLAAEVFWVPNGIAVVDSGWSEPMNPTHPFHILEGGIKELSNDDPIPEWRVGPHTLRPMVRGADSQTETWDRWLESEFRWARSVALEAIRECFPELRIDDSVR